MGAVKLYTANALTKAGVLLKSGTGGGAPPLDQDPDWPESLVLCADREMYWKTSASPPAPLQLDLDLGSAKTIVAAGIMRARIGTDICTVYYNPGATYNPASGWVAAGPFAAGGMTGNNNLEDIASIIARFWRFEFDGGIQFSCKPWLMEAVDTYNLTHDWSVGTAESMRRLREETVSSSGLVYAYEPAEDRGSLIRSGNYLLLNQVQSVRDAFRERLAALDTQFVLKHGNNVVVETILTEGDLAWSREWHMPEQFNFAIPLTECP